MMLFSFKTSHKTPSITFILNHSAKALSTSIEDETIVLPHRHVTCPHFKELFCRHDGGRTAAGNIASNKIHGVLKGTKRAGVVCRENARVCR